MVSIEGIITALVTPMHADESLNLPRLSAQVNRQIDAGIHGLFCLGTNGEAFMLRDGEKRQVIETTVAAAAGRVPVYAGTGCIGTRETVALSREAERLGADVLSVICPYFAAASQQDLIRHFTAVADAVSIPVLLYNIPARTGVSLQVGTVQALARVPNIVGIKDSSGNFDLLLQLNEKTPEDFIVLSGNDSLVLWNLMAGGRGGICGTGNLFPERLVSIYTHWRAGGFQAAKAAQDSIRAIRDCLSLGNPNTIIKLAANLLGHEVGPCRQPFWTEDEAVTATLAEVLRREYAGVR